MEEKLKYIDLLYFGYDWSDERAENKKAQNDFIAEIKQRFPNVQLENAYDNIKGFRQEVYIDEANSDNYYSWLIGNGWIEFSFSLTLMMMSSGKEPKQKERIEKYLELAKKEYPQNFKN